MNLFHNVIIKLTSEIADHDFSMNSKNGLSTFLYASSKAEMKIKLKIDIYVEVINIQMI